MRPHPSKKVSQQDLFRSELRNIINMNHELVKLGDTIDWSYIEKEVHKFYCEKGRPGLPTRMIVGLHILKQMYNLSDEAVCERFVNDPYFQYFCGEEFFQHDLPIERPSMTHFRKRVGEDFCKLLLQESLHTAYRLGALKKEQAKRIIVDTTVQPKAITFPTDAKLRYRAIINLTKIAKNHGIELRQSYVRVAKWQVVASCRYRHAKQMRRARKAEKKLNVYLGRIIRDIERKLSSRCELKGYIKDALDKAGRIHDQQKTDTNKIYSWHEPHVECISKGKAHKPYEFGCKVSITTNVKRSPAGHFVLHATALHNNPHDGHTLNAVLTDFKEQTGITAKRVYVDKGYRGHCHPKKYRVFISGQKRGVTATIKKELKRRSAIEPLIGHLKNEGRLGRNYLRGCLGDRLNALLVSAGYNFKLILHWLRRIFWAILGTDIFRYFFQNLIQKHAEIF